MFYFPFTALTTIFVHTVSSPPDQHSQSNIALMEIVVGFFGRLEYITSGEAAFTKSSEFVRQARKFIDNYETRAYNIGPRPLTPLVHDDLMTSMEISLREFECEEMAPMVMSDLFDGEPDGGQYITAASQYGTAANQSDQHLDPANQPSPQITLNEKGLYSEFSGLLASPSEEIMHGNWL